MKLTNENLKEVGAWLKTKRSEKGLTSYQLEMDYRLHRNSMHGIEGGEKRYTIKSLLQYCEAIGVKITLSD